MFRTLVTLLALAASVQAAIETAAASDDEAVMLEELYSRLFGPGSHEPLEPEEARGAIQRLYEGHEKYYKHTCHYSSLVGGLARLEQRVAECNFENTNPESDDWRSTDSKYFNLRKPALNAYMTSLRARMVECFRHDMKKAVQYCSSKAKADRTGAYAYFKKSLADIRIERIVGKDFIKTKDKKISRALVKVMEKKYGESSHQLAGSSGTQYTQLFLDSVVEQFCRKVVRVVLVPRSIQSIAYRKDTIAMLGEPVVNWAKVQHVCEQIMSKPRKAAKIVYESYLETKRGLRSSAN